MKSKVILMMLIAFFYLNQYAHAQWKVEPKFEDDIYSDTLHIILPGKDKVLLMGKVFKELPEFAERAESLKTTFISDLKAAYANGKLTGDEQELYYFYKDASHRRLKAEAAEYTNKRVDVAQEMYRLDLLLPKHKFVIIDMESKMEWQIFVGNPDSLVYKLENLSLKQAIEVGTSNKMYRRQSTQLWVNTDSSAYSLAHYQTQRNLSFSIGPEMGLSLIGSKLAPNLGIWAMFQNQGKYGTSPYKVGLGLTEYIFADFDEGKISNYQLMYSVEGMMALNTGYRSKNAKWIGIQAGVIRASATNELDNAQKLSILTEGYGPFSWTFDMMITQSEKLIYGLTLKLPF